MATGPVLVAFDGTPASADAVRESGALLAGRPALVLVVWKAGLAFELMELPTSTIGLPPAPIDVRTAMETKQALYERAQRLAEQGAALARDAGFEAESLVVAEEVEVTVAETIVRVARDRDAQAVVVGAHGHGRVAEVVLGSTTRDVIRHAPCPVVVVRGAER
jgi:nucleotide-binding universal stress UspA family protein